VQISKIYAQKSNKPSTTFLALCLLISFLLIVQEPQAAAVVVACSILVLYDTSVSIVKRNVMLPVLPRSQFQFQVSHDTIRYIVPQSLSGNSALYLADDYHLVADACER